jgi:hypothetical protein
LPKHACCMNSTILHGLDPRQLIQLSQSHTQRPERADGRHAPMLRNRSHRGMMSGCAAADSVEGRGAPTGPPNGGGLNNEPMSATHPSCVCCRGIPARARQCTRWCLAPGAVPAAVMAPAMSRRILSLSHLRRRSRPTLDIACTHLRAGQHAVQQALRLPMIRSVDLHQRWRRMQHLKLHLVCFAGWRSRSMGSSRTKTAFPALLLAAAFGAATAVGI